MITEFIEGEVYRNEELDYDVMVYGIFEETDTEVTMAIVRVDRENHTGYEPGEIVVNKEDYGNWSTVEYGDVKD